MPLEHEELTSTIIGAGISVHRALGPGFVESVYENAMAQELDHLGMPYQRQASVSVRYRDVEVGRHRLDLFVAEQIVVELKAIRCITNAHFSVVRSYLRAVGRKHGLIINFSKSKIEVKRVIITPGNRW